MCVCVQAARRKNVQTRQLRDKKETNDAHVVRRRYSFKNSRWILDDDTNRCQSNLSSLFFYFHFLLERLFVRNISFPSEYNPRVFFFFVPFSFFFLFDLALFESSGHAKFLHSSLHLPPIRQRILMRVPIDDQRVQFIIPRSDAFYQAAFLIESGARDHSCRPIFKREPSGHPRTPRVRVRGPKWQSCSVSYVTPPRLLCFSLGSLSEIRSIVRSMEGKMKETEDLKKKRGRWDEIGFPRCASLYHRSVQVAVRSSVISYR